AARIVAEAARREVTLLSCWPALDARGFWESALMPMLNFVVFTLYPAPLALKRRADASLGIAHGACLLAHGETYARVGGHAAVRAELFEDVRLAQAWRKRGEASLCLDGQGTVSVRMYRSFAEIWGGFQKNFYPAFRRASSFWVFMATHLTLFLLPFILAPFALPSRAGAVLLLHALCVLAMRAVLTLRFGHSWWSVLLHPLGEAILLALGLSSWWRCRRSGRGVVWKGRRYHGAGAEQL
ncbi:MAG TPA: glycosyltransferase, partial [Pyrinomonadaceae bacterium]|nr:glycosyltransferase [Pyrinomonadaceae bacterium]